MMKSSRSLLHVDAANCLFIYIVNYVLGSDTCFMLHFVCFCLISQLKSVPVLHIFYQAWKCCLDVARHSVAHSCVCLPHGSALQNGWTDGQSILVLYLVAGYCKIGRMGQFCHFQSNRSLKAETLSASGGLRPLDPPPGALPLNAAGGSAPQTPVIGSRSRARHVAPPKLYSWFRPWSKKLFPNKL